MTGTDKRDYELLKAVRDYEEKELASIPLKK